MGRRGRPQMGPGHGVVTGWWRGMSQRGWGVSGGGGLGGARGGDRPAAVREGVLVLTPGSGGGLGWAGGGGLRWGLVTAW